MNVSQEKLYAATGDHARLRAALQILGEVCPEIWTDYEPVRRSLGKVRSEVSAIVRYAQDKITEMTEGEQAR